MGRDGLGRDVRDPRRRRDRVVNRVFCRLPQLSRPSRRTIRLVVGSVIVSTTEGAHGAERCMFGDGGGGESAPREGRDRQR